MNKKNRHSRLFPALWIWIGLCAVFLAGCEASSVEQSERTPREAVESPGETESELFTEASEEAAESLSEAEEPEEETGMPDSEALMKILREQAVRREKRALQKKYLRLCRHAFGKDFTFAHMIHDDPSVVWEQILLQRRSAAGTPHYRDLLSLCRIEDLRFPQADPGSELLERRLANMTSGYEGIWSVYTKNLMNGEETVIHDVSMRSASVMKLFVMAAVYQGIADGERRGIDKVNQYLHDHGYSHRTHEYNGFQSEAAILDKHRSNRVTGRDCAKLLESIYHRQFGSYAVCNEVEKFMLAQHTRYKIPAGIARVTDQVLIGNKTGEMDYVENDVAIVYSPACDYILCIFSDGWTVKDTALKQIQDLSEEIYRYYNDSTWLEKTVNVPAALMDDGSCLI